MGMLLILFPVPHSLYAGCSAEHNMTMWAGLISATEKAAGMVIEVSFLF
jgi:hypothetical protein